MKPLLKDFLKSKKAFPVIVVVGFIIMLLIIKSQPELSHTTTQRPSTSVSYIELQRHQLEPEIVGFGTVEPDLDLEAKAEVTGRVTYIHPSLKKGELFTKDTLVIQIDDKDYQLQLKQAEADLIAAQANLKEMEINIENNKLELSIAKEKLKVREKEYARLGKLRKQGSVSQSSLEKEKQNLLQQKQEMQQLTNRQTTLPSQLEVVKAKIEISKAKLEKSKRDLARTQVRIPFSGRISEVFTEQEQYIATGTPLFNAVGLDKVVINAQFPIDQFRLFAKSFKAINQQNTNVNPDLSQIFKSVQLSATVEIAGSELKGWTAKVERFSDNLDPRSRTIGVIVSVTDSYKQIEPGNRPPLLEGMYMKVLLHSKAIETIALPRFSLHENQVYTITADNLLKRVTLTDIQYQGSLVLVNSILKPGDRIITSDLFPAVDGMKLTPIIDQTTNQQMQSWIGADK